MFNNIIGNEANKEILKNIVENNNISHSYIFSGISGIGKFMFAKEFAKAILCTEKKERPCNNCKSCESFDNSNNPDVIIIDEKLIIGGTCYEKEIFVPNAISCIL